MRAFLVSHPNIAIPAVGSNMETYFYGRFGDLRRDRNFERCLRSMLRYKHVRFLDPDPERIRQEFHQGPRTYERLFSLFLIHYAEREGKPRWGAQTGLVERYADHLFAAYPGVKVVHMVRDPRDRYEASLALWPNGRGRAGGATARWRYSMRLAERNLDRFGKGYLVVRYEDLVLQPETTIRSVLGFLGEGFLPEVLAMSGAPEHREKLLGGARGSGGPLSTEFIGLYRDRVPKEELAFIQSVAGRQMRAYGYLPDQLPISMRERGRYAIEWPNQLARMMAWRGVEAFQQRFPRVVGRKPDRRMILVEQTGGAR